MAKRRGAPPRSPGTRTISVRIESRRELEGIRHELQIVHDGEDLAEWILEHLQIRELDPLEWVILLREAAARLEQQYRPVLSMGPRHTIKAFKMAVDKAKGES